MPTFKKITVAALALGVLAPAFAFAQTASTTGTALVGQIQSLNAQIAALQQQRDQAVVSLVNTIRQGSSGEQVAILQALLAADSSIYPEGVVSGFFGKLTAQAVKRFQKKHGLEQVGNVGPKTLRKLQEFLMEHPLAFTIASSTSSSTHSIGSGQAASTTMPWRRDIISRRPCAIIPPGHLIATGWLKKHKDEDRPIISECERQNLPPGIRRILDDDDDDDDDRDDDHRRDRRATTTPPVQDTLAPVIFAISASNIGSTTATVSWTTNENATGKVYYGTTTPVALGSALTAGNNALVTSHSFGLTGLATSTTYYYVLESKDAATNTATTSTQSFATVVL